MGKGENAGYRHLLLHPQFFSKCFPFRFVKTWYCVVIKVFKTGSSGFPPSALRVMGTVLQLARQRQDDGMVKYWLKIVQETWICELSPLNN